MASQTVTNRPTLNHSFVPYCLRRTICATLSWFLCRSSYISRLISHGVPHNTASPRRRQDTIERDFLLESILRNDLSSVKVSRVISSISLITFLYENFCGLKNSQIYSVRIFSLAISANIPHSRARACPSHGGNLFAVNGVSSEIRARLLADVVKSPKQRA